MSEVVQAEGIGPVAASRAGAGRGKLTNIQALRAVAAASVALSHSGTLMAASRGDGTYLAIFNDHLASFGVSLFFAISGFLMAQLARATDPGTFLVHRALRIYPIFFVVVALALPLRILTGRELSLDAWTMTLAPVGPRAYPLGVEWTLLYETSFYLAIFLIAALGLVRRLELIAGAWLGLLAVLSIAGAEVASGVPGPRLHTVLLADANASFAAGLLIPWLIQRRLVPVGLCHVGVALAAVAIWTEAQPLRWVLAVPAVLIVAGLVQTRQISVRGPLGDAVVRLGDWSYVLYLVHLPVLTAVYRLAPATSPTLLLFVVATGLALAATALLGPLDVALYRGLRRVADRAKAGARTLLAFGFAAAYLGAAGFVVTVDLRSEREAGRARAALARLPAGALEDAGRLDAAIAADPRLAAERVSGRIDRAVRLADGRIMVVGWAIDDAHPDDVVHLAIACGGRIVALGPQQRYRADVAAHLGREDLKRRRLGFTLSIDAGRCASGIPLLPLFVDGSGGVRADTPMPATAAE